MMGPEKGPSRQAHFGPLGFSVLTHGLVRRMTGEDEAEDTGEMPQAGRARWASPG